MRIPLTRASAAALAFFATVAGAADRDAAEAHATRLARAHVMFLGDDLLEGRGAGTRGYDLAAAYVAAQFRAMGLQPAGADGTFRQPVPLLESIRDLPGNAMTLRASGAEPVELASPADFLARPTGGRETAEISGPLVFVGYAVHAPEHGYSDFEGLDLRGKIALVIANAPAKLPGTVRAHHSSTETKLAQLAARGAIGMFTLGTGAGGGGGAGGAATPASTTATPAAEATPAPAPADPAAPVPPATASAGWNGAVAGARNPGMYLLRADGSVVGDFPGLSITGAFNAARTEKLFAASGQTYATLLAGLRRNEPQSQPLNIDLTITSRATVRRITCHNVLGLLPGSDPALANDIIVVTCHLDHLGIGPAQNGDTIFNGVMDNAGGVAIVLAAADQLSRAPTRPRRSILFAAVTAEEKGLLGSRHLSANPPNGRRFAANINIDMGPFFAPLRAVIGYGREHTNLGPLFDDVAAQLNWKVVPDPNPAQRIFVRSDQYSFVREGIPALYLDGAPESTDPAFDLAAMNREFMRARYHKRTDDLQQPIHYESIGAFAVLTAETARVVADAPTAPAWLPGDFFGELFGRRAGDGRAAPRTPRER